ncbi:methyltransferase domain-containing protein [bacterium]|nr:methyltransferase domain-containing protein [bacterium]
MEKIKSHKQFLQEDQYVFPYHYVPQIKHGFTQTYNLEWGFNYISVIEFIVELLKNEKFDSLADVGTGDGRLVAELSQEFPQKDIIGIDYSDHAIALAQALNPSLHFQCGDIMHDTPVKCYDCITLIEVFEHIPLSSAHDFAQSLSALSAENGFILISVPHKNVQLIPKHYQHFTTESLMSYFEPYFFVEEKFFLEKQSAILYLIRKMLTNRFFLLNHQPAKNLLYAMYKSMVFRAEEKNCGKLLLKLRKKARTGNS